MQSIWDYVKSRWLNSTLNEMADVNNKAKQYVLYYFNFYLWLIEKMAGRNKFTGYQLNHRWPVNGDKWSFNFWNPYFQH